jgi:hypothetical protein
MTNRANVGQIFLDFWVLLDIPEGVSFPQFTIIGMCVMRRLQNVREVVAVLGGIPEVVKLTNATTKNVYYWTGQAHSFPARYFKKMNDALKKKHCSAPAKLWCQAGYED